MKPKRGSFLATLVLLLALFCLNFATSARHVVRAQDSQSTKLPSLMWSAKGALLGAQGTTAYFRRIDEPFSADRELFVTAVDTTTGAIIREIKFEPSTRHIVIDNGIVYTVFERDLVAIDFATGQELWRKQTAVETSNFYGGPVAFSRPRIADGVLYVDDIDDQQANIYALDAATGTEFWRARTEATEDDAILVADGSVYVADLSGTLHAFDVATGQTRWSTFTGDSAGPYSIHLDGAYYFYNDAYLAAVDGIVLTGLSSPTLVARDAETGAELWRTGTSTGGTFLDPIVANDMVYVAMVTVVQSVYSFAVHAYDLATGRELWQLLPSHPTNRLITPVVRDGIGYLVDGDELVAINAENGHRLWQARIGNHRIQHVQFIENLLYVVDDEATYAFDLDGTFPPGLDENASLSGASLVERIISTTMLDLQPVPGSTVGLWRITYQPGAAGSILFAGRSVAAVVQSGIIAFDNPVPLILNGRGQNQQEVFDVGQQFLLDPDSRAIASNPGSGPVVILAIAVLPPGSSQPAFDQSGIAVEQLATLVVPEPWGWGISVDVYRLTIPPSGGLLPSLAIKPELILVESGSLKVTVSDQQTSVTLRAGETASFSAGSLRFVSNANEGPLQVFVLEPFGQSRAFSEGLGGCAGRCLTYRRGG